MNDNCNCRQSEFTLLSMGILPNLGFVEKNRELNNSMNSHFNKFKNMEDTF